MNKSKKTKGYSKAPPRVAEELEYSTFIDDFLPPPEIIAKSLEKRETIPVTMKLKKDTVERYKRFAEKKGIKYQTFVSTVLDTYAKHL